MLGAERADTCATLPLQTPHTAPAAPHPQTALSLLPNLTVEPLPDALFEVSNDEHLSMFVASLGRSVVALHDLLLNKSAHAMSEANVGVVEDKVEEKKEGEAKGAKAGAK
jgi:26S proteasome regulatory subunit N8